MKTHFSNKWNSIIEVVLVLVVVTIWLNWAFWILQSWIRLADNTQNRIKAVNIAREWIEMVQNIRDTNWIKYSSDYNHCWNVLDYNMNCVWALPWPWEYLSSIPSWSYILDNIWTQINLKPITYPPTTDFATYKKFYFPVYFDSNWLVTQTWSAVNCSTKTSTGCLSIFTREIIITYTWTTTAPSAKTMVVHSIVKWKDASKNNNPYVIDLTTNLTNRKENLQ